MADTRGTWSLSEAWAEKSAAEWVPIPGVWVTPAVTKVDTGYIAGGNPQLTQNKREMMFVQLLEGLHPDEADLLVAAKDKALHRKYKGLSANVVKTAFNWNDEFMVDDGNQYPAAPGLASGQG